MNVRTAPAKSASGQRKEGSGESQSAGTGTTELLVAQIWEDVLNRKGISRTEDFFDLGGTSLDLIRVFGHVKERFDLNLDGSILEGEATIARLAKCIDAERAEKAMQG